MIVQLVWAPVAAWLVIRLLPGSFSKFVEKEIERRSDAKLERLKAELQGAYSGVKSSVDVLAASNSGMRPHIITAVTALWAAMNDMREKFGGVIGFDNIILAHEADEMFNQGTNAKALAYVSDFKDRAQLDGLTVKYTTVEIEQHRLFCGDRLWLLFYIYRAIVLRSALLINWSYEQNTYRNWRTDKGVGQQLRAVMTEGQAELFEAQPIGGLAAVLSQIEADFLHEATRVMSGSKAMSDSLSDIQAMIALRNSEAKEQAR